MPQRIDVPGHGIVEFPDGMSEGEIVKAIQANSAPTSISVGDRINSELSQVPRQLGLTARYGIEGTGQALQPFTEPIRQYITDPVVNLFRRPSVSDLVTGKGKTQSPPMGEMASGVADWLGLPKPQGANERVIGDASRLMAGVASLNGISSLASKTPGLVGQVGENEGDDGDRTTAEKRHEPESIAVAAVDHLSPRCLAAAVGTHTQPASTHFALKSGGHSFAVAQAVSAPCW
jgi:hypothetical protein